MVCRRASSKTAVPRIKEDRGEEEVFLPCDCIIIVVIFFMKPKRPLAHNKAQTVPIRCVWEGEVSVKYAVVVCGAVVELVC